MNKKVKVRVSKFEFPKELNNHITNEAFRTLPDFITLEGEPVEEPATAAICCEKCMRVGSNTWMCGDEGCPCHRPATARECCGEWTGKESYECNRNGARTKPFTCNCPCHRSQAEICECGLNGGYEHEAPCRLAPKELPVPEPLKFEQGFANSTELAVIIKINELIEYLRHKELR